MIYNGIGFIMFHFISFIFYEPKQWSFIIYNSVSLHSTTSHQSKCSLKLRGPKVKKRGMYEMEWNEFIMFHFTPFNFKKCKQLNITLCHFIPYDSNNPLLESEGLWIPTNIPTHQKSLHRYLTGSIWRSNPFCYP